MMLGLTAEMWTAIGSIAAVVALPLSVWIARSHRGSSDATSSIGGGAEAINRGSAGPEADAPTWPPDAHFEVPKDPVQLRALHSGDDLLALVRPADEYDPDNDKPNGPEEVQQIADAQSAIFGWVEASDVIDDPGEWVTAGYELTGVLDGLRTNGWTVYGALVPKMLVVDEQSIPWRTAIIRIKRTPEAQAA